MITTRKLPAILSFLDFIEDQRRALHAGDWAVKFGRAHARITADVLPAFGPAIVAEARRMPRRRTRADLFAAGGPAVNAGCCLASGGGDPG